MRLPRRFANSALAAALALGAALGLARPALAVWPNGAATNLPVAHFDGDQAPASLVPDGVGGAFAFWGGPGGGTPEVDVWVQHITVDGELDPAWPATGVRVFGTPRNRVVLDMLEDGAGGVLVIVQDITASPPSLWIQRLTSHGTVAPGWSASGLLIRTAEHIVGCCTLTGGLSAIVAWSERVGPADENIRAARVNLGGFLDAAWPAGGLSVETTTANTTDVRIVSDGGTGALIGWMRFPTSLSDPDGAIFVKHVRSNATFDPAWPAGGRALRAPTTASVSFTPKMVGDGAGGAFVQWTELQQLTSDKDVFLQRVTGAGSIAAGWPASGVLLSGAPNHDADNYRFPLVADGSGGAYATWMESATRVDPDARIDMLVTRVTAAGTRPAGWTTDGFLVFQQSAPFLPERFTYEYATPVPDGSGGLFVLRPRAAAGGSDIVAHHLLADGTNDPRWSALGLAVTTATGAQYNPAATSDGRGGFISQWQDERNGAPWDIDVYAQRVDGAGFRGDPSVSWTPAIAQASMNFNWPAAGSQRMTVLDSRTLQGHRFYTFEAWVKPRVSGTAMTILGNDRAVSWWFGIADNGRLRFSIGDNVPGSVDADAPLPVGTWSHVAATYSDISGVVLYVNGQTSGYAPLTDTPGLQAGRLHLGADSTSTGLREFFRGQMDDVRIWNVVHSDEEIQASMATGPIGGTASTLARSGLLAEWTTSRTVVTTTPVAFVDGEPLTGATATLHNAWFQGYASGNDATDPSSSPPSPFSMAWEFDGSGDHHTFEVVPGGFAAGVTVYARVRPNLAAAGHDETFVGRGKSSSWWLGRDASGNLKFVPFGGSGVTGPYLPANRWTTVAASAGNGHVRLYVNGVLVSDVVAAGTVGENGRWAWAGADSAAKGGPIDAFTGALDDAGIVNGVLSPTRVRDRLIPRTLINSTVELDELGASRQRVQLYPTWLRRSGGMAAVLPGPSAAPDVTWGTSAYPWFTTAEMDRWKFRWTGMDMKAPATVVRDTLRLDESVAHERIGALRLWVSARGSSLANLDMTLTSPAGDVVHVVSPGTFAATDQNLESVVLDAAPHALGDMDCPWNYDGVRPSQTLARYDGQNPYGDWILTLTVPPGAAAALHSWGLQWNGTTVGAGPAPVAHELALSAPAPNPATRATTLRFVMPSAGDASLVVYDASGRVVRTLARGAHRAGEHVAAWDLRDGRDRAVAPGLYFARLLVAEKTLTRRIVVTH